MKALLILLSVSLAPAPVLAQHEGHAVPETPIQQRSPQAPADDSHAAETPSGSPDQPPPSEAFSGPEHAADTLFDPDVMAMAREDLRGEHGDIRAYWLTADRLESRFRDGEDGYLWDVQAWYGGDIHKLWLKSEGEGTDGESPEDIEIQVLWSRAIRPFWNFQAGVRYDFEPEPEQGYLTVGLQGLAPFLFESQVATFLSEQGDVSARLEFEYDLWITQRLILQPHIELNIAAQDVPELQIGSGVTDAEIGLRLQYQIAREFVPYVGVEYERRFGETADFARSAGEDVGRWNFLIGIRVWF